MPRGSLARLSDQDPAFLEHTGLRTAGVADAVCGAGTGHEGRGVKGTGGALVQLVPCCKLAC